MYAHTAVVVDDEHVANVTFQIQVKLFKAMCANTVGEIVQEKVRTVEPLIKDSLY